MGFLGEGKAVSKTEIVQNHPPHRKFLLQIRSCRRVG
jgi:hypothetical protein